ncbi:MAG: heavy metal translocating P-type ATPase [Spirochaetes bacterium]|nr:heavy metal translocating P-type ATPase [Spirochaetota bacterium]
MRAAIVHSLPGRVRLRVMPGALAGRDAAGLAASIGGMAGVKNVKVNPRTGSILAFYDGQNVSEKAILNAVLETQAPKALEAGTAEKPAKNVIWTYIGSQLFRFFLPPPLKPFFTVLSAIPFLVAGLKSLAALRLDVPALDAASVGASLACGNIKSASTLIMLLKTGEYLEAWAKQRSHENIAAALFLNIEKVWIRCEDGLEKQIPYGDLRPGDHVVLRSGSLIPIDGKVIEGRALVNEAGMTGEPLGKEKSSGSTIYAGTVIEEGELVAEVQNSGGNTRYEQIIALIEKGEGEKTDREIRANSIANKAVPFTFAAAALTLFVTRNAMKAVSVLSVDYSCAIKLATPLAFLAAIREGLQCGVFFKGSVPMEKLAACDTFVFDKTGTLTMSSPALVRVTPYNGFTEKRALKIAACLEEHFPHPVANAVVAAALEKKLRHKEEHTKVKYIAAHGITAEYRGKHTAIGSRHFVEEDEGIDLSIAAKDEEEAAKEGHSLLYLACDKKLIAILAIKDPVREEAKEVIAMLRHLGAKRVFLLSGDNKNAAEKTARELSLDGGLGALLPQDKAAIVKNLRERGCRVAFVGDGMNDSPAMSAADVGIAMKGCADLAGETADIALKESSLYPLVAARLISQRVMKRIDSNTTAAIALNSAFILMALLDKPVAGGEGRGYSRSVWLHNLTSIAISVNAMRPLLKEAK